MAGNSFAEILALVDIVNSDIDELLESAESTDKLAIYKEKAENILEDNSYKLMLARADKKNNVIERLKERERRINHIIQQIDSYKDMFDERPDLPSPQPSPPRLAPSRLARPPPSRSRSRSRSPLGRRSGSPTLRRNNNRRSGGRKNRTKRKRSKSKHTKRR